MVSYLKFRPLSFINRTDVEGYLFAWPVVAIPIRYWAVLPTTLDLLERSVLALIQAGIRNGNEIRNLLGISEAMAQMVDRTLNGLEARNFISARFQVTPHGQQALRDEELYYREFRQGYLFFDQVRGMAFPFVNGGRLSFHSSNFLERFPLIKVPAQITDPEESQLRRAASLAVAAFNRQLPLLAALDEDDWQMTDLDRIFDLEISDVELTGPTTRIEDIEFLADISELLEEEHYLLIEVVGGLLPGRNKVELRSYSPFSQWEQNRYVEILRQLDEQIIKTNLVELEERVRQLTETGIWSDLELEQADIFTFLQNEIEAELGNQVKLPNHVIDNLLACEYLHKIARQGGRSGSIFRRDTAISEWATMLESTLELISTEINSFQVPASWPSKSFSSEAQAWTWYEQTVIGMGRSQHWLKLPQILKGNLETMLRRRNFRNKSGEMIRFGEIYTSSSRDKLIKILLASLTTSLENLPPQVNKLALSVECEQLPLQAIDDLVGWRNLAAHGSREINQWSDQEYAERLEQARTTIYTLLRQVFIHW